MRSVLMISAACWVLASADRAQGQSLDYEGLEAAFGEPITLSATGAPKTASSAPANLRIISGEDIRRSGAVDIAEVLDRFPGVQVTRTLAGAPEVSIRGYIQGINRQLLVLVDGREVYLNHFASTLWSSFPVSMEEIQQIELVLGPSAAIFGPNAYAGVINVITKNALPQPTNAITLRYGAADFASGEATATLALNDNHAARLAIGGFRADSFDDPNLPPIAFVRFEEPDAGFMALRSSHRFSDALNGVTEFTFSRQTVTNYFRNNTQPFDTSRFTSKLGLTWSGDSTILAGNVVYERTIQDFEFATVPRFRFENDYVRGQLSAIQDFGRWGVLRGGLEYRRDSMPTAVVGIDNGSVSVSSVSASSGWDVNVTSRLAFSGAFRVDVFDQSAERTPVFATRENSSGERVRASISANAGLTFNLTSKDTLRLLYGRASAQPNIVETNALQGFNPIPMGPTVFFGANPELEPMVATNYEFNYVRTLTRFRGSAGIAMFYRQQHKIIDAFPNQLDFFPPGTIFNIYDNIGDSESVGGEVFLEGRHRDHWRYGVNYAFIDIEDDLFATLFGMRVPRIGVDPETQIESPLEDSHYFEGGSPKHEVNLHVGYERGCASFDLYGAYLSDFRLPLTYINEIPFQAPGSFSSAFIDIDSRFELGGRLAYRPFKHVEAAIQVNNVLDDQFREGPLQEAERRWFASLTVRW